MQALIIDEGRLTLDALHRVPEPGPGEALIRVILSGICNTDLEVLRGYKGFSGIPGHEFVGVVEESEDPAWTGMRVVGDINCACGSCKTCLRGDRNHCPNRTTLGISGRDGTMAEFFVLPRENLFPVPDGVCDEAAVFVEPLAAALEILDQTHVHPTDEVVVIGDGKLGLLIVQVLRLTGCSLLVVGRHARNLGLLERMNVPTCLESEIRQDLNADVVVECTGHAEGFRFARGLVRPRGRLIVKSTFHDVSRVDLTALVVDEIELLGSRCGPFAPALRLLDQGLVDPSLLVEGVYPLAKGVEAFRRAQGPGALKVLLRPGETA